MTTFYLNYIIIRSGMKGLHCHIYTKRQENEVFFVTNDICPAKSENDNKCIKYIAHINVKMHKGYLRFCYVEGSEMK